MFVEKLLNWAISPVAQDASSWLCLQTILTWTGTGESHSSQRSSSLLLCSTLVPDHWLQQDCTFHSIYYPSKSIWYRSEHESIRNWKLSLVCAGAFSISVLLLWFLNSSSPSRTRQNGTGEGETKEYQLEMELGKKFRRAAKGTTVSWKLISLTYTLTSTWSNTSLNYCYPVCKLQTGQLPFFD